MTDWQPRVALVRAERHVNYQSILNHILERRRVTERAAGPVARRIGHLAVHQPIHPAGLIDELAQRLEETLMQTARFGYREARAELASLRQQPDAPPVVTSGYQFPDAGQHGVIARGGLDAIRALVRQRAHQTAAAVADAARSAAQQAAETATDAAKVAAAALAATSVLHNHVLELVGETLNLGRTAGISSIAEPPRYAMRSEQLDQNTCEECDAVHGEIVEIDSAEYWDLMPPSLCLGGGRCRGIYVYGDDAAEVALDEAA